MTLKIPGADSVPLIIGGASSIAAKTLLRTLSPLSVPLVSCQLIQLFIKSHPINLF